MAGLKIGVILHERELPSLPAIYILIGAAELQQGIPGVARSLATRPLDRGRCFVIVAVRSSVCRQWLSLEAGRDEFACPLWRVGISPRSLKRDCVEARTGTREERQQREQLR